MKAWSEKEVELTILNYFEMLSCELLSRAYSKTAFRKKLIPLLNNRSKGAIEFKNQNISAVLVNLGLPYIKGYLPRYNYQKILRDKVIEYLAQNQSIEKEFNQFVTKDISFYTHKIDFNKVLVKAPENNIITEPESYYHKSPIKINYLEKEQNNHKLGLFGEELVMNYEKWHLTELGKTNLADNVRWVSRDEGDGLGFDILSRNLNGTDKYIEVKTTRLGKETPFYFSENELTFSNKNSKNFHLYRLFNFDSNVKFFTKTGSLDTICKYRPVQYKGYF